MADYMLDTSAIGEIAEGAVNAKLLYESPDNFYITHVQEDELAEAGPYLRVLMTVLEVTDTSKEPTESFVWDHSRLGEGKWGSGDEFDKIKKEMSDDDGNEIKDTMIADTAVENGFTLVTHDGELESVVNQETSGTAISVSEFASKIN